MKVRLDFISNSSSSSFLMIGRDYTTNDGHTLTIEDFENLRDGERFFLIEPNMGEGDYVIMITPDMMLDFDMQENRIVLDTHKFSSYFRIFRKFCGNEYDNDAKKVYDAEYWGHRYADIFATRVKTKTIHEHPLNDGERVMGMNVEDHAPTAHKDVMKWLKERYSSIKEQDQ
jgi:hypothetical protein